MVRSISDLTFIYSEIYMADYVQMQVKLGECRHTGLSLSNSATTSEALLRHVSEQHCMHELIRGNQQLVHC